MSGPVRKDLFLRAGPGGYQRPPLSIAWPDASRNVLGHLTMPRCGQLDSDHPRGMTYRRQDSRPSLRVGEGRASSVTLSRI
jgi:hypothetical protein